MRRKRNANKFPLDYRSVPLPLTFRATIFYILVSFSELIRLIFSTIRGWSFTKNLLTFQLIIWYIYNCWGLLSKEDERKRTFRLKKLSPQFSL